MTRRSLLSDSGPGVPLPRDARTAPRRANQHCDVATSGDPLSDAGELASGADAGGTEIKRCHDPMNPFRSNQNALP